ncbi:Zinc uptake regulation protein Zur, partial [Pseudomonas sp. FEN]
AYHPSRQPSPRPLSLRAQRAVRRRRPLRAPGPAPDRAAATGAGVGLAEPQAAGRLRHPRGIERTGRPPCRAPNRLPRPGLPAGQRPGPSHRLAQCLCRLQSPGTCPPGPVPDLPQVPCRHRTGTEVHQRRHRRQCPGCRLRRRGPDRRSDRALLGLPGGL